MMFWKRCIAVGVAILVGLGAALWGLAAPAIAVAQPIAQTPEPSPTQLYSNMPSPTDILSRLFTESDLQRVWFADSFLAQISLAEVSQIIEGIKSSVGAFQSVEDVPNGFMLSFERGQVPAHLALNARGQITGLLFETPQLTALSLDQLIAEFEMLPGSVHILALKENEAVAELNASDPLAVGSTFKLFILSALQQQIEAGVHRWDEVVALQEDLKSLPSGFLQTWPAGSQLTVESLATLMISQSDNTATDHLLHFVGRQAVEDLLPGSAEDDSRNRPFLATREAFVLKDPANARLLQRWRRSRERRSLLAPLAALPMPDVNIFNAGPQALDVEWFFTAKELCQVMKSVADLPLMQINPGLLNSTDWQTVAFKGGSEPGVENFTTYLVDQQNNHYCIAATWNQSTGIDELKFSTLYRSLIEGVRAIDSAPDSSL